MKTDTAVRREGMSVLLEKLGNVDAERFISLVIRDPFDYTEWRREHLENEDVRTLSNKAMDFSKNMG